MISIKSARQRGVPLIVVETPDPAATIAVLCRDLNGSADTVPILQWDCVRALQGLNDTGQSAAQAIGNPETLTNPAEALAMLAKAPANTLVFILNAQSIWTEPAPAQAIWNLRDTYKGIGATCVLLVPSSAGMPVTLTNDCVVLSETLPDEPAVLAIIASTCADAGMDAAKVKDKDKLADALLGLPAFAAEQCLALSITKDGIDRPGLWERKRKMIEQTPGLSVWRGGETFADVGGYDNSKDFMRDICKGNGQPRAVVFIDEIEKCMAGAGSDSSGTTQDQLRCLLTYMQDKDVAGTIFIGPPGSGKSAVAKATGNEANIPTISLDLGGMKASLVGQSEARLRSALNVIDAVSQGKALFIATCNSIGILPPELRRRFSLGTFFFPLPRPADRLAIWKIYRKKLGIAEKDKTPPDEGWTGAEIRNCCLIAWRLKRSLIEASKFIVPVAVSAADSIDRLCRDAHRRYINAAASGLYEYDKLITQPVSTGRKIEV
jgi:hypothetical protein